MALLERWGDMYVYFLRFLSPSPNLSLCLLHELHPLQALQQMNAISLLLVCAIAAVVDARSLEYIPLECPSIGVCVAPIVRAREKSLLCV
jgi:hypothetical protein